MWLNNPRRGEEACGTSGMKAAINGVLNLSILDGWFDEALRNTPAAGRSATARPYSDDQDALHASAIYYLLENEIVPMFYERREGRRPREWMQRMKQSLMYLTPQFDARRMVNDYDEQLYGPAHRNWQQMSGSGYEEARRRADWNARVRDVWAQVNFVEMGPAPSGPVMSGKAVAVRAAIQLAGLRPEDVRVECVIGRIGTSGGLEETEVVVLPGKESQGDGRGF